MVTKGVGRFINRPTRTCRGSYDKFFVYVPTELARDSNFPLKAGDEVEIMLDVDRRLVTVKAMETRKTGRKFLGDARPRASG